MKKLLLILLMMPSLCWADTCYDTGCEKDDWEYCGKINTISIYRLRLQVGWEIELRNGNNVYDWQNFLYRQDANHEWRC